MNTLKIMTRHYKACFVPDIPTSFKNNCHEMRKKNSGKFLIFLLKFVGTTCIIPKIPIILLFSCTWLRKVLKNDVKFERSLKARLNSCPEILSKTLSMETQFLKMFGQGPKEKVFCRTELIKQIFFHLSTTLFILF